MMPSRRHSRIKEIRMFIENLKMISTVYHADLFAHTRLRKIIYQHSRYVIEARN